MAGPAPASRPLAPPRHSAVHSGFVPTACARHAARSVAPNRFSGRLRPGQPRFQHLSTHSRRRRSFPRRDNFSAVSTWRAAHTSSPGASTLRAELICRAVPAFALPSIRYRVTWQAPHPPGDLWRRQATRRCTPGPFRPRAPATRRGPSHRAVSPAGCGQGSRASSVRARISVADGHFHGATFFCGVYIESRVHF